VDTAQTSEAGGHIVSNAPISEEQPMHRLTVTIEDLASGISTTIAGKAKDVHLTVEDDLEPDPIDLMNPLAVVRPIERWHVSVDGDVVADYSISYGKGSELARLRVAVERVREAVQVTRNDPLVHPVALATALRILRALDG